MRTTKFRLTCIVAAVTAAGIATPALAGTGCNGVVNILVWGCAPWDNNNGPKFPYFKKKAITIPKEGTQIVTKNGVQMALRAGVYYPLIANDGASIVAGGAGNFRVWSGQ